MPNFEFSAINDAEKTHISQDFWDPPLSVALFESSLFQHVASVTRIRLIQLQLKFHQAFLHFEDEPALTKD